MSELHSPDQRSPLRGWSRHGSGICSESLVGQPLEASERSVFRLMAVARSVGASVHRAGRGGTNRDAYRGEAIVAKLDLEGTGALRGTSASGTTIRASAPIC